MHGKRFHRCGTFFATLSHVRTILCAPPVFPCAGRYFHDQLPETTETRPDVTRTGTRAVDPSDFSH